jgi:copper chaperone CopZ
VRRAPRTDWDPSICDEPGGVRWPLAEPLGRLRGAPTWPTLAQLGDVLAARDVRNARGLRVRPVPQAPRARGRGGADVVRCRDELYDVRIDGEGALPTRACCYHDLFNALVWASFPRAKAAIAARQHAIWARTLPRTFTRLPSARTREQDALAMLDEGGLLLATVHGREHEVAARVETGDLEALHAAARAGALVGLVFGHAVHEHFVSTTVPVRAATVILPLAAPLWSPSLVARVDEALAERVRDPGSFSVPPASAGLLLDAESPLALLPAEALPRVLAEHTTNRMTHELTIDGMSCGHCVQAVREALSKVPGVTRADVALDPSKVGHAHVEGAVERAALVAAIEAEDYRVRPG